MRGTIESHLSIAFHRLGDMALQSGSIVQLNGAVQAEMHKAGPSVLSVHCILAVRCCTENKILIRCVVVSLCLFLVRPGPSWLGSRVKLIADGDFKLSSEPGRLSH